MPAFLETDVLLDQPGTAGEQEEEGHKGNKGRADRLKEELKTREEERRRRGVQHNEAGIEQS